MILTNKLVIIIGRLVITYQSGNCEILLHNKIGAPVLTLLSIKLASIKSVFYIKKLNSSKDVDDTEFLYER